MHNTGKCKTNLLHISNYQYENIKSCVVECPGFKVLLIDTGLLIEWLNTKNLTDVDTIVILQWTMSTEEFLKHLFPIVHDVTLSGQDSKWTSTVILPSLHCLVVPTMVGLGSPHDDFTHKVTNTVNQNNNRRKLIKQALQAGISVYEVKNCGRNWTVFQKVITIKESPIIDHLKRTTCNVITKRTKTYTYGSSNDTEFRQEKLTLFNKIGLGKLELFAFSVNLPTELCVKFNVLLIWSGYDGNYRTNYLERKKTILYTVSKHQTEPPVHFLDKDRTIVSNDSDHTLHNSQPIYNSVNKSILAMRCLIQQLSKLAIISKEPKLTKDSNAAASNYGKTLGTQLYRNMPVTKFKLPVNACKPAAVDRIIFHTSVVQQDSPESHSLTITSNGTNRKNMLNTDCSKVKCTTDNFYLETVQNPKMFNKGITIPSNFSNLLISQSTSSIDFHNWYTSHISQWESWNTHKSDIFPLSATVLLSIPEAGETDYHSESPQYLTLAELKQLGLHDSESENGGEDDDDDENDTADEQNKIAYSDQSQNIDG